MSTIYKGLVVGLVQVLIVSSLGAKLLYDRQTLPRVWIKTLPVDPDLPIRGRYVELQVEMEIRGFEDRVQSGQGQSTNSWEFRRANLSTEKGVLVAQIDQKRGSVFVRVRSEKDRVVGRFIRPLAFYIPEHVPDPSVRMPGEELWAEITVPKKGPPRPIRLGVKYGAAGEIIPIDLD
jgi:hypothetical protein